MSPAWLTSLVKARQMQEDTARRRVADARRSAGSARARATRSDERVDELCEQVGTELTAPAFVAAAVALQSAAAVHSAAVFAAGQADLTTEARVAELRVAATARGAAEKIREHVDAVERVRVMRIEQAQLDETAARIHRDRIGGSA